MNVKGMLPIPLALEIKREIYDFLNVSFEIKATKSGDALTKYYTETSPIVKGPFVKVSLPYEATSSVDDSPLDLKMKFPPYRHQVNAFERLHYTKSQNTIVTTGTGSGKTECFLYPILDYVSNLKRQNKGNGGIKAIILYPMNALLDDQAIRFIKTIKEHQLENLDIRVGKYTGNGGRNRSMDFKHNQVINHRDELVVNPPDILLTNYKMLDYMLFRDKEKNLWNESTKEFLKYLVLDEMHTFDGAQGSDVACLIRRLKIVAEDNDSITFVGTSATLSSDENAKNDLCNFASTLFGSTFSNEAIIEETKHSVSSYLSEASKSDEKLVGLFEKNNWNIEYNYGDSIEEYCKQLLSAIGAEDHLNRRSEIGHQLSQYNLFQELIKISSKQTYSLDDLAIQLNESSSDAVKELSNDQVQSLIVGLFTLASYARHPSIPNFPFLTIKTSLWASELRQTLSKVVSSEEEWEFVDENEVVNSQHLYLPSVYCSHCGESGWASYYTENEDTTIKNIVSKPHAIRSNYAKGRGCILFPVTERVDCDEIQYLYRNEKRLVAVDEGEGESGELPIPVVKSLVKEGRCPACDTKLQVRFFSLGASSLATVVATSCFSHPLNQDRKLISFSDSVQDASHQSSFINNRSYSFSFKKFISKNIKEGDNLSNTENNALKYDLISKLDNNAKKDLIGQFAPDKLRKKWMLGGYTEDNLPTERMMQSLVEVARYNTFGEFTFNSRFGWSFEKVGHSGFFIDHQELSEILKAQRNIWIEKDSKFGVFNDDIIFEQFLHGFLQRLKSSGAVYHPFLEEYYSDKAAQYYRSWKKHQDLPLNDFKIEKPKFFMPVMASEISRKQNYETLGSKNSWYWRWFTKFCNSSRVHQFYEDFSMWLEELGVLIRVGKKEDGEGFVGSKPRYVLNSEILKYNLGLEHFECSKCHTRTTATQSNKEVLDGSPCTQRFCSGKIQVRETRYSGQYFKRYFSQESRRINASEHTGSFDKELKAKVEESFKKTATNTPNYDTNYLSCTPTMEMGIDIGDLSSVLLKSVPRNAASYFQRIGRSGRTTGNSLDFLVIDRRPHNMYFWMEPSELLNWNVVTPACRYKTTHILQRQFNAYCLDQYLHNSKGDEYVVLPNSFKWLEDSKVDDNKYWEGLFKYCSENRNDLLDRFFSSFSLSDSITGEEIKLYSDSNGVQESFYKVFNKIKDELAELDQNILKYRYEISKINPRDEHFYNKVELSLKSSGEISWDDLTSEFDDVTKQTIMDLFGNIVSSRRKRDSLLNPRITNILSVLADYGVLPGYAFPEAGCELDFNIRRPNSSQSKEGKDPFYSIAITRPPESALSELAPFNHFYTHGYEAKIDRLGIYGKKEPFQELGFCPLCGHVSHSTLCEVCNIEIEKQPSYDFKKAKATTTFNKSYVSDSKETREVEHYEVERKFLFDAPIKDDARRVVSFYNEDSQFGYEFQTNVEIYTFNLGTRVNADRVDAFSVCKTCGAVQDPKEKKRRENNQLPLVDHYKSCSSQNEKLEKVILFRNIHSDAVRIPVLNPNMVPIMKAVLKRGVELHLKGDTGHIAIADYTQEGYEGNTFIVVFDNVPGGTGHLRDLFGISLDSDDSNSSPKQFLKILRDVLSHIQNCKCSDGCYHCVWSAENIKYKEHVTKKGTIFHLQRLISQSENDFQKKDTGLLEIVREHSFDGQTEAMLFHALNTISNNIPFDDLKFSLESVQQDQQSSLWKVEGKEGFCYLKSSPYESISLKKGGATKPDFHVLDYDKKVIGYIYTDGSRYHLNPGQESCTFENDIALRQELSKQYNVPVLSFTYKELDELGALVSREEDLLRKKEFYKFNPRSFDIDSNGGPFVSSENRVQLTLSLVLRLFGIAIGKDKELSEIELKESFLPWATGYKTDIMSFNRSNSTFEISMDVEKRSEFNKFNQVDVVSEDYYLNWISFWQVFNVISLESIARRHFKYASLS